MSSANAAIPLHLQPVNGHGGAILKPLPDFMGGIAECFWDKYDHGLTKKAIAKLYGLSPADVFKVMNGTGPAFSPRIVEAVFGEGYHTQEVRLVVRVAPGADPLPDVVYLDLRGGASVGQARADLSLQEVADLAECSLRTVQRYVKRGAIEIVELVPGRPASHRVARVAETEARTWAAWYRSERKRRAA